MRALIAAAMLAASFAAHAGAAPEPVKTFESAPGETMDNFALRVAPWATNWSGRTGSELCGEFERVGDTLRLVLQTTRAAFACDYAKTAAPSWTGISFHTHTLKAVAAFTPGDYAHPGYMARARLGVIYNDGDPATVRRVTGG